MFEEETEEEEEINTADCLGVQEEHWKEAILFPVPNSDPKLDCSLRADMSRYEKDLRLIRFVEILGMVNISIKGVGATRLHVLDRNTTGAFVIMLPVSQYKADLNLLITKGIALPESYPHKGEGAAFIIDKSVQLSDAVIPIFTKFQAPFTIGYSPQYRGSHVISVQLSNESFMAAIKEPVSICGVPYTPVFESPTPELEDYYVFGFAGVPTARFMLTEAFAKGGVHSLAIRRAPNTFHFVAKIQIPFSLQTMDKMQKLCASGGIVVDNPRQPDTKGYKRTPMSRPEPRRGCKEAEVPYSCPRTSSRNWGSRPNASRRPHYARRHHSTAAPSVE